MTVSFVPQFVASFSEMRDSLGGVCMCVWAHCELLNACPVNYIQGKNAEANIISQTEAYLLLK